ncbi:LuxR C-terminal-related transcriptional regulator [Moheibacter lacus]|uniref:Response regulator transcription factor n=1 Tax=Moheibacter lacus TaxID=2745851 RepID=A0A838ZNV4_9FLAO|nr:LuxR C-terminal-related transcriptional regulator [Moheibacter lacus]MBA5628967.1 response regulator transcription factor [Moheibacter lacus]
MLNKLNLKLLGSFSPKLKLVLWLLFSPMFLWGQSFDPIQLNKEISDLNNQYKYDSSILKLEEIITRKSSTHLDKYYAFLQKALTYKRLFNYPETLDNLDFALKEGKQTNEQKAVNARILTEKMFIQYDLLKFDEARSLFQQINPEDFHLLDGMTKAFYLNVASTFHCLDGNYVQAERDLNQGLKILEKENPEHLAAVYCKLINLAEHLDNEEMAKSAFASGIQNAEKYNMQLYKIRLYYDLSHFYLVKEDYKNAYKYEKLGSDLSGKYNAPFESGKLNLLEKELINKRRKLELQNEENRQIFLIIITVILSILILVLILLVRSNKEKRKLTERENDRMRLELEKINFELNEKKEINTGEYQLNLTNRQQEIIDLVKQGFTNKEIGNQLFISENTVKYHLKIIYNLLGIDNRMSLK